MIRRRGAQHSFEAVELATLEWVDQQPAAPGANRYIPPVEAEQRYYAMLEQPRHGTITSTKWPPEIPGLFTVSCGDGSIRSRAGFERNVNRCRSNQYKHTTLISGNKF
ncbi:hypothetical protein ABIF86_000279 [Bradyrhizobium japonicum]